MKEVVYVSEFTGLTYGAGRDPQRQGRTFTDWGHHVEEYLCTLMMREERFMFGGKGCHL